jgi:hypothetical protein
VANYPLTAVAFTEKVDLQDVVRALDVNVLYREVAAIASDLGTGNGLKFSGTWVSNTSFDTSTTTWSGLSARLQNIESGTYITYTHFVDKRGGSIVVAKDSSTTSLRVKGWIATASVTAATGNGTTVEYTANNTFVTGQTVVVTGLGISNGASLNLTGTVISSGLSATKFSITNSTIGVSSGTGVATVNPTLPLQQWSDGNSNVVAQIAFDGAFKAKSISGGTP